MQRLTLFLLLTLSCLIAAAQTPATDEEPEPRQYTVEIVIFAYAEDISVGTELFVPDPPPADTLLDLVADEDFPGDDREVAAPRKKELEFLLLTEDTFTMGEVVRRFEQLDVYETIMHVGWTQWVYPQDQTDSIDLRAFGAPPQGLEGSFLLYLGRFLHLVVDLALDAQPGIIEAVAIEQPANIYGDRRSRRAFDPFREAAPVRYRIQENRIFKNGDIRYFDHPKFGVVVKVTRVEVEETDDDLDATGPSG